MLQFPDLTGCLSLPHRTHIPESVLSFQTPLYLICIPACQWPVLWAGCQWHSIPPFLVPSCRMKRAASIQQLPTSSFSSKGCVNESPDTAEPLVLGKAQRHPEQSQHFKYSSALPGVLGDGMAAAATTSRGRHLGGVASGKGGTRTVPVNPACHQDAAACYCPTQEFHHSRGEMAVKGSCTPRVLGRVAQTPL